MKKALLLLLLPLLLASCSSGNGFDELVICSSLPLDGGDNERAVSMSRAIELAIDEQNAAIGGARLDGTLYPLRHVPMDDTIPETGSWDTGQEARNARAAIAEHDCVAYIGTFNSGAAKIAIPILNRVQMAMISPGNTYPGLTKPNTGIGDEPWVYSPLGPNKRNFCRVVPADDLQAPAAARYAAETLGVKRVFIFHDAEVYGKGLADLFAQKANELGMEVITDSRLEGRNPDLGEVPKEIKEKDIELVYFGGVTENGPAKVLEQLKKLGYTGYFMGADGIAEPDFLKQSGVLSDTQVLATLVGQPLEKLPEAGKAWIDNYEKRYGTAPDPFAAPSYEAALVVIHAIEQADLSRYPDGELLTRARPAILDAMKRTKSTNFDSILESWDLDENCDTTDTTITINQAQNIGKNGTEDPNFVLKAVVKGQ